MACNTCAPNPCSCFNSCREICSSLTIKNSWNIPACQESAVISIPGLETIQIGSYIWNSSYGYFLVQAINPFSGQVTIKNECLVGNAAGGTIVPACTQFMVSAPPVTAPGTGNVTALFPYLAVDFVAPADSICIDITVTNVNGLYTGGQVQIGAGTYTVGGIPNSTTVNICNDGEGITPGTVVSARTTQGLYQYPVTSIDSCCTLLTPRVTTLEDSLNDIIDWSADVELTASVGMTLTDVAVLYAKYALIGTHRIWYALKASFTTVGPASFGVIHTVPFAIADTRGEGAIAAKVMDGGRPLAGVAQMETGDTDNTHMEIGKYDQSNWGVGAGRVIWSGGVYEI